MLIIFDPNTANVVEQFSTSLTDVTNTADASGVAGQIVNLVLNVVIGIVALVAVIQLWRGKERSGMNWALVQIILSLTLLQLVTFYLSQFTAVLPTIIQFLMLAIILAYQRWYLNEDSAVQASDA